MDTLSLFFNPLPPLTIRIIIEKNVYNYGRPLMLNLQGDRMVTLKFKLLVYCAHIFNKKLLFQKEGADLIFLDICCEMTCSLGNRKQVTIKF